MEFPVWHLSGISSGLLIAIVSVIHVFVAQFAVGGGIYLVWMERRAWREDSPEILQWLERHTHFFLLLTMVFGALTGVGIWFTISVVNPAATSMLIHNFVFFWAAEWVFFFLEVVTLIAYYYTYPLTRKGIMPAKIHMQIGMAYAVAGFLSLVLINGIITFMLTPGNGLETGNVWVGFFNPTFWPSLVFRTGICLILAGMFALFTASRIQSSEAKRVTVRISSMWIILPFLLILAGTAWYVHALPPSRYAALLRRTADIHPFVRTFAWILPVIFLGGVLTFVRAERLRKPLTLLILCTGLILVGSFESIRETGRRPWIAEHGIYSNGVSPVQALQAKEGGSDSLSGWIRILETMEKEPTASPPLAYGLSKGSILYAQQCAACHGVGKPRIDLLPRVGRLTPFGLDVQLTGEGRRLEYMPPFAGDRADSEALTTYLETLRLQHQRILSPEAP